MIPTETKLRVDLHSHTKYSDGKHTVEQMFTKAKKRGLDAVAITDHNSVRAITELAPEQVAEQYGIELIPGAELSFLGGHFLVYGIPVEVLLNLIEEKWQLKIGKSDDPTKQKRIFRILEECVDQGGCVIAAHPCIPTGIMSATFPMLEKLIDKKLIHGAETNNHDLRIKTPKFFYKFWRNRVHTAIQSLGLPAFSNSDAHRKKHMGSYHNLVEIPTGSDFISAMRAKQLKLKHQER